MNRHATALATVFLSSFVLIAHAEGPPKNLSGQLSNGTIQLVWDAPDSDALPLYYNLYRSVNSLDDFHLKESPYQRASTDYDIMQNTYYRYRVTAIGHDSSESLPSDTVTIYT